MKRIKIGFSLIEVTLVLGIAGLIFLMVFVALPALQRQAHDAQRRDDILTLISAIKKYQSNNRGALPSSWASDLANYLPDEFADPDGTNYALTDVTCNSSNSGSPCSDEELTNIEETDFPNDYKMYVISGATCDGSSAVSSKNKRNVAVVYRLEVGAHCNHT